MQNTHDQILRHKKKRGINQKNFKRNNKQSNNLRSLQNQIRKNQLVKFKQKNQPINKQMKPKQSLKILNFQQSLQQSKQSENENWSQLRLPSGSLNSRSYHTISYYFKKIYIYGGYELHTGVKDDFFCFDYTQDSLGQPEPVKVRSSNISPGPLCRHTASLYKDKLIIYGGRRNAMERSNQIYIFDFIDQIWIKQQPNVQGQSKSTPFLESHSSCIDQNTHKMYVFGGFEGTDGHTNKMYEYDIQSNTWSVLTVLGKQPSSRSSHCAVIIKGSMYVFGGQNGNQKFGDFWQYNVCSNTWQEIIQQYIPQPRNGHSMCVYQDHIILFGGILGVTREVNDLQCYSVDMEMWIRLEDETKYDDDLMEQLNLNELQSPYSTTSRKNSEQSQLYGFNSQQNSILEQINTPRKLTLKRNQLFNNQYQMKMITEQKQKIQISEQKHKVNSFHNKMLDQFSNNLPSNGTINTDRLNYNSSPNNEQLMFEQYMNGQNSLQKQQQKRNYSEQNSPSMRLQKQLQIRSIYNQQYINGLNMSRSNSCRNGIFQNSQLGDITSQNDNNLFSGESSFSRNLPQINKNDSKKFYVDHMIENASSLNNSGIKSSRNSSIRIKGSPKQNESITNQNSDFTQATNFISFAARADIQSQNPIKKGPLKESMNTLFDKIKRVSMNPLLSKEDKKYQITELRKKILLREFVEQDEPKKNNRASILNIQTHSTDSRASLFKDQQNEGNDLYFQSNNDVGSTRFPALKSPTTDAMRKAIKATESKIRRDSSQNKFIQLNMSQMLEQFKSVKIDKCRIKNIKPQPRDGHAAIIVDDFLVIIGGDRHKLSFNDMFECNLKSALQNPLTKVNTPRNQQELCQDNQFASPKSSQQRFSQFNKNELNLNKNQIHS